MKKLNLYMASAREITSIGPLLLDLVGGGRWNSDGFSDARDFASKGTDAGNDRAARAAGCSRDIAGGFYGDFNKTRDVRTAAKAGLDAADRSQSCKSFEGKH